MEVNRVLQINWPVMDRIVIPSSESPIFEPRILQVFFNAQKDRDDFCRLCREDMPDFVCVYVEKKQVNLEVEIGSTQRLLPFLRSIYGWEAVDKRLRRQM